MNILERGIKSKQVNKLYLLRRNSLNLLKSLILFHQRLTRILFQLLELMSTSIKLLQNTLMRWCMTLLTNFTMMFTHSHIMLLAIHMNMKLHFHNTQAKNTSKMKQP